MASSVDMGERVRSSAADLGALEELYDRYAARAYALALGMLGDPERAEDAVCEGMLAAWRGRSAAPVTSGVEAIRLLHSVRDSCMDRLR